MVREGCPALVVSETTYPGPLSCSNHRVGGEARTARPGLVAWDEEQLVGPTVLGFYPGATCERLREVKRRYDPENLFHLNHNIPPADDSES